MHGGIMLDRTGTTVTPVCWVGRWGYYYDTSVNAFLCRRRWYDPSTARWTSCDPLFLISEINGFSYVRNTLLRRIDPSGLISAEFSRPTDDPNEYLDFAYLFSPAVSPWADWAVNMQPNAPHTPGASRTLRADRGYGMKWVSESLDRFSPSRTGVQGWRTIGKN